MTNFADKTIWTGDNLDILRGLNSASVDLIYLDPPFNSNRDYAAPVGSAAAGAAFKDTWALSDLDTAWMGLIADEQPALYQALAAAGLTHGKRMQSYLCMMAVRLLEMRRILKDSGSIYLHCDPTASHYLKLLLDSIYGADRFVAEITWKRATAHNDSQSFGSVADYILCYGNSINVDAVRVPLDPEYVDRFYRHDDNDGKGPYTLSDMASPNPRVNLMYEWRGYPPPAKGWRYSQETMAQLDADGLIWYPDSMANRPRRKRYLSENPGQIPGNIWTDIAPIATHAKERIGYPTQKPLALLERIIRASSNPGDVVLDPFCGCATACVAAESLGRRWLGIDISPKAVELVNMRLRQSMGNLFHNRLVTARTDIPRRTDIDAPRPYRQNKHILFGQQEGRCAGCRAAFEFRHLEVDHIIPRAAGGTDHIENLQLLCGHCNRIKGDRPQAYLIARLREMGMAA